MDMKLYHHKTSGGAEYLTDTFIPWKHNGKSGKEGTFTDKTRYVVRIDGDITKDAELTDRLNNEKPAPKEKKLLMYLDQYGYKYFARNRAELVKAVAPYSKPRVSIMYRDKKDGSSVRCGYIVGDHWCTAYEPIEIPA